MRVVWIVALVLVLAPTAFGEPPAPMEDRVKILEVEMRRGPAEALKPFLTKEAHNLSRWYAIRALGRIGDRGKAPEMLAEVLASDVGPLEGALWAAGIAQTDKLYDAIKKHITNMDATAGNPGVAGAAAEALGWTGKADAINDLTPLLAHPAWPVRRGALMGLARLRPEGVLERVAPFVHDEHELVRSAAGFACWMIAGARARAAKAQDKDWDGDMRVAKHFLPLLEEASPDRRMDGLRALSALLPKDLELENLDEVVAALADDKDPRVVQDTIWRLLRARKGEVALSFLAQALGHADAKVRQMAAETLGQHAYDESQAMLAKAFAAENDARVKEVLVLELARVGDAATYAAWAESDARKDQVEAALRQLTDVQVLLLRKEADAVDRLLAAASEGGMHAVAMMTLLGGLEDRDDPKIEAWLGEQFRGAGPYDIPDAHVAASAISLIGTKTYWKLLPMLKQTGSSEDRDVLHDEVRLAMAGALGDFGAHESCSAADRSWIEAWLRQAMYGDRSAWVRARAKASLEKMDIADLPEEDVLPPTDWKGLPRPTTPVLGLDLTKGDGAWLSEREILQLADAIFAQRPLLRFETTQGTFDVELDAENAPVHAVSALLAVHAGVYDGTRWHRVVPNFVIQGGDPHGHGAGNGGWFVPDEITRFSYQRGALGMPKSRKDDGGCQLFFMHTHYIPLDGRYTRYGMVVEGMESVDKIRVGDTITKASIVTK
ncbi:MAG: peptidylprolyl isomerase [Planctomycetota bacterium]|nr:peptidylprolyl isomerase [Planctomycetota bacterium]